MQVKRLHLLFIALFLAALGAFAYVWGTARESAPGLPTESGTSTVETPPVVSPTPETVRLLVYYPNSKLGDQNNCEEVFSVERELPYGEGEAMFRTLFESLLAGPTPEEKSQGFHAPFAEGSALIGYERQGAVIYADFNAAFGRVAGSCRVLAIRSSINSTLRQFSSVEGAVISIEGGDPDEALQP